MDLLNLGGDERLDLGDLTHATNLVPTGLVNELTGSFLVSAGTNTIISGFRPSGSGQGPVQVGDAGTPNSALLGQRLAGAITQGVFSAVGPQTINLSVSSLPANTYGIFVRFNRLPGATQTRKFWSKAAPGSEYAQLADTRLVAAWEARLEVSSPSAEWLQIGQVVVTSAGSGQGNTITVTDQRPLYFEGTSTGGYAPTWGTAADRSTNRQTAPIGTLQRQLDALRQCIVDIKGRGLASWYQPNIAGMQIGSGFGLSSLPVANQLAIGDSSFYLQFSPAVQGAGAVCLLAFNGTADYFTYSRSGGFLSRLVNNTGVLTFSQNGGAVFGAGSILSPSQLVVNQTGTSPGYGVSVQAPNSGNPAALGLFSASATSSYIEFGPTAGSLYGYIQTKWGGSAPSMVFGVASTSWLTSVSPGASGGAPAITFTGQSFNVNTTSGGVYFNNRQMVPGVQIWAAGVYAGLSQISVLTGVNGLTATANYSQDAGGHYSILITFSQTLPNAAIVNVSGRYNETTQGRAGKVYQTSWIIENSTQIRVACANAAQDPEDNAFSFMILYGT